MKKILFFVTLFLLAISANAQKIQLLDKSTLQPIPDAYIYTLDSTITMTTDAKGYCLIETDDTVTLYIQHHSYSLSQVKYSEIRNNKGKMYLEEKIYVLQEVIVSAGKFEEKKEDVPRQVEVIKEQDIAFYNQASSADLLQNSGQVLVQKSQLGGGSPVIRGFEANKVLIMVDGVRMNNAIYRGGHLQNVVTIDQNMLSRTELLFGSGSVMYGSDALGGVMHFYSKKPVFSTNEKPLLKGNSFFRYGTGTAMNEKTGHIDINLASRRIAYLGSFTYSDFGDLIQGRNRSTSMDSLGLRPYYIDRINGKDSLMKNSNIYKQVNSGYSQYDMLHKLSYKQNQYLTHTLNFQYSNSGNVPRYDRLTDKGSNGLLRNAEWYYGPQKRLFTYYGLNVKKNTLLFNEAKMILSYQNIEESRHNRRYNSNNLDHRIEKVGIYAFNIDLNKNIKKHEFRYGAEYYWNDVNSKAYRENIGTGVSSPVDTRYPDGGNNMQSIAVFAMHTYELTKKVILTEGIRYSHVSLLSKFKDTTFFPLPFSEIKQKNNAFNGNFGIVVLPTNGLKLYANASSGFRAANVDDLSKVFESGAGTIYIPNANIKPEYTYTVEEGFSTTIMKNLTVEGNSFYTWYKNAIITKASTYQGADSIMYNGQLSKVVSGVNASNAYVYGFSTTLKYDILRNLNIGGNIAYTRGMVKTDSTDQPLDHIPPVFGRAYISWKAKKVRTELYTLFNGWKKLRDYSKSGEDNLQYATAQGMPSWYTLNLKTSFAVNQFFILQLGVENILDRNYRVFASGISAPGRNISITVRGTF